MDALPDELLLLILGFVDDGTTLLDAVPLVCKRWHRVSKDPRAWASVSVDICVATLHPAENEDEGDDEDGGDSDGDDDSDVDDDDDDSGTEEDGRQDGDDLNDGDDREDGDHGDSEEGDDGSEAGGDGEKGGDYDASGYVADPYRISRHLERRRRDFATLARILLHAPYLHSVCISWSIEDDKNDRPLACSLLARRALSALLRSKAAVRRLAFDENGDPDEMDLGEPGHERIDLLADLLDKFKDSLRYLRLGHLQLLETLMVYSALLGMKQLKSVCLTLGPERDVDYLDVVEGLLPRLEHLKVYRSRFLGDAAFPPALMASLVRGAKDSLRRLDFECCPALPPAVADEVRRCEELRELTCHLTDVAVLPALPRLAKVSLLLDGDELDLLDIDRVDAAAVAAELKSTTQALSQALAADGSLSSLRQLNIKVRCSSDCGPITAKSVRSALRGLLGALAVAVTETTSVQLHLPDPALVEPFLEHMPRLRSASITFGTGKTLALLTKLPELETLTLTVPSKLSKPNEKATKQLLSDAAPAHMPRLRTLHVNVVHYGFDPEKEPVLRALLEATAAAAAGATTLHLNTQRLQRDHPVVGTILLRMPGLRVLELSDCCVKTMAALARLPELEELNVGARLVDADEVDAEGRTLVDILACMRYLRAVRFKRVNSASVLTALARLPQLELLTAHVWCREPEDEDSSRAAVDDFKAHRPDVRSTITVQVDHRFS